MGRDGVDNIRRWKLKWPGTQDPCAGCAGVKV